MDEAEADGIVCRWRTCCSRHQYGDHNANVEQVHKEVMLKEKELLVNTLKGVLKSRLTQNWL